MSYPVQEYTQQTVQPVNRQGYPAQDYAQQPGQPINSAVPPMQMPPPYTQPGQGYPVEYWPSSWSPGSQPAVMAQYPVDSNIDTQTCGSNDELTNWTGFSDKAIRRAFVRKVYAILLLQLLFTVAVICIFIFVDSVKKFVIQHVYVFVAALIAFIVIYIALLFSRNLRRSYPANYITLFLFTLSFSYLVGSISSFFERYEVLIAMGMCASCCLGITLYSFQTKYDFTSYAGVLFIFLWVLIMFAIVAPVTYSSISIVNIVYATLGALLFMAILAFDTHLIMGGKKYEVSAEEHVFAALQLYIDVVYIFLFILAIMGGGKK